MALGFTSKNLFILSHQMQLPFKSYSAGLEMSWVKPVIRLIYQHHHIAPNWRWEKATRTEGYKKKMKGKESGIGKVREEVYTATDDFVIEEKTKWKNYR